MLKKIGGFLDDLWIMAGTIFGLYLFFSGITGFIFDVIIDKIYDEMIIQIAYVFSGLIIIFVTNGTLRRTAIDKIKEFLKKK